MFSMFLTASFTCAYLRLLAVALAVPPGTNWLKPCDTFERRHIGPSVEEEATMLEACGVQVRLPLPPLSFLSRRVQASKSQLKG
jgi:hypothetical protein